MRNDKEKCYQDEEENEYSYSESQGDQTGRSTNEHPNNTISETDREYNEESIYNSNQNEGKDSARNKTEVSIGQSKEGGGNFISRSLILENNFEINSDSPKMKKLHVPSLNKFPLETESETVASTATKFNREFVHNLKIFTFPKEVYSGEVDENYVRNGYGVYEYSNGDIYEGEFMDGLRHGEGEYSYNDGSIYRGYWENDRKHGKGTFKFEKYEFDGDWDNDTLRQGFTFKIKSHIRTNSLVLDEESDEDEENDDYRYLRSDIDHNYSNSEDYYNDENSLSYIEKNSSYVSEEPDKLIDTDNNDELCDFIIKNNKTFALNNVKIETHKPKYPRHKLNLHNLSSKHTFNHKISEFELTHESTSTSTSEYRKISLVSNHKDHTDHKAALILKDN